MWELKNTYAIGGLENIGYAPHQDHLLVLSSQGEGLFNCITGERIARVRNGDDWWERLNQETNTITGFDLLSNIKISTYGLHGEDNLPKITKDGWSLKISDPEPDDLPFEKYLVQKIYLVSPNQKEKTLIAKDGPCELRAFGFSDTGNSLIVALSCEIVIYSRQIND